jgi:peptide/nickel transport system permease protein
MTSRLGSAAVVILAAYIVIGLLDSLHYRPALENRDGAGEVHYAVEVLSVLDRLLGPLRTQVEKTYSAPFATHLFTRETVQHPDGSQTREYPRLQYGGRHLADPHADARGDILRRSLHALLQGAVTSFVLLALLVAWQGRRHNRRPARMLGDILRLRTPVPWLVIWGTLSVLVLLVLLAVHLATAYHVFGTDKVGQDVFYQALKSIRTGLVIGTLTTLVMLPFAIFLGILAGYARGWVDDLIQYLYTTLNSIPGVLLIAAAILMLQVYMANHPEMFETTLERADIRLLFLCIILGITSWTGLCRLLRGESLKLREAEYIQAATAFGVRHGKIITRHILPNVMHIVLITVVLDFSGLVLAEAVLSYVGVGVDPTMNSWGNMINSARLEMAREPVVWWSLLAAFLFMFTLVLAANLFSDAVRDAFDPRLRQRG